MDWEFPYYLGCVMGSVERREVATALLERGVTQKQIDDFKALTLQIVNSFYRK